MNIKLSRSKFESLVSDLVERSIEPCQTSLERDAGLGAGEINDVILVAWHDSRMPKVIEAVANFFGKRP